MTKTATIIGLVVLIIAAAGLLSASEPNGSVSSGKISAETDAEIRATIVAFGSKLKNVSLLSPTASAEMESEYSVYLTPALLAQWKADPTKALGRQTSSPWPDRIEVVSVSPRGDNVYIAESNIIEIANADTPGTPAAVYPATLTLQKDGDIWHINGVAKGAYSETPQQKTITGVWECLPHQGDGPHTMECAFGIKTEDGKHYAVSTSLMSQYPVDYPTGSRVKIQGVMVPKNQLNSDAWVKYDIEGIIGATTIEQL
ncbi:MAG: hypothetical protein V4436_01035 [Patescibacteria group bacterium]